MRPTLTHRAARTIFPPHATVLSGRPAHPSPQEEIMEQQHVKSFDGMPEPPDIFQPHMPGVELLSDMDAYFAAARRLSATGEYPSGHGEPSAEAEAELEKMKGQHSVIIVTPGRLLMPVYAANPDSMPEPARTGVRELLPPDPPKVISVISYTYVPALIEDKAKGREGVPAFPPLRL